MNSLRAEARGGTARGFLSSTPVVRQHQDAASPPSINVSSIDQTCNETVVSLPSRFSISLRELSLSSDDEPLRILDDSTDSSAVVADGSQPNDMEMITPENIVSTRALVEDSFIEDEPLSREDCFCCGHEQDGQDESDDDVDGVGGAAAADDDSTAAKDDDDEMADTMPPLPCMSWSEIVDGNDGSPILRERVGAFQPRVLFPPRKRGVVASNNCEDMKKKKRGT